MHILVTGGAGFIGSHLCERLLERGDRVTALDNLSTGRRDNVAHLIERSTFSLVADDAYNSKLLGELVAEADAVVHLAAAVGVQLVIDDPVGALETNIELAHAVLKRCRARDRRLLIASSSEVYGRGAQSVFSETDDLVIGPPTSRRWGYAASKLVDEFLALAYFHEHRLPVTVLRLFNTVGPRQVGRYGMVIPRLVVQALRGEALTVYGDGEQRRTFTSVFESTRAIAELIGAGASYGEILNIGGRAEVTINQLAKRIIDLTKSSSSIEHISYEDAYGEHFEDMRRRNPDTSRLRAILGWAPDSTLDDILRPVIDAMRVEMGET